MGKKKSTKNVEKPKRYAGVRFSMDEYYLIGTDGENITLQSDINGVTKEYDVTGGGGGGKEYEEVEIWRNGDPSKGLKVDTLIAEIEFFETENFEYIKIRYRNMNNQPDQIIETIIMMDQLLNNGAGALISTGDYNESIGRHEYYARPVYNNNGGVYFLGQCREISAAATDKNFRAVPEIVYGYKPKEV